MSCVRVFSTRPDLDDLEIAGARMVRHWRTPSKYRRNFVVMGDHPNAMGGEVQAIRLEKSDTRRVFTCAATCGVRGKRDVIESGLSCGVWMVRHERILSKYTRKPLTMGDHPNAMGGSVQAIRLAKVVPIP